MEIINYHVYLLPIEEVPNIPVPTQFVWGAPNIQFFDCTVFVSKENTGSTGCNCPNEVLELIEPNNHPPDACDTVGLSNSKVLSVLIPNKII